MHMRSNFQPQSICILGRQPALGLAELESLYGAEHVASLSTGVASLDLAAEQIDFSRLGGSTRLATIVAVIPSKLWKDTEKQLAKAAVELASQLPEGKLQLGLSAYNIPITPAKLNATGLTLKKILRGKTGRSVRVTPNPELELNTAQVLHNHLTGATGLELLVIASESGQTIIARTVSVQDIESYTRRDRNRPKRDARVGMLPPKLAQVLVNLAAGQIEDGDQNAENVGKVLLDPFCGTGVALQEAMLMGYSVYGTDLEPRMIDYSRANLDWLIETTDGLQSEILLEPGDATTYQWNPAPNFVASETYLGRPFTERPSAEVLAQTVSEVNLILKKFLRNIHGQLAPGTRLCLAVPAWQITSGQFKHLPLVDQLNDLGYNRLSFEHIRDEDLLYYREDQIVARQLLILTVK
jgi:SAM-dependent methyltransferase